MGPTPHAQPGIGCAPYVGIVVVAPMKKNWSAPAGEALSASARRPIATRSLEARTDEKFRVAPRMLAPLAYLTPDQRVAFASCVPRMGGTGFQGLRPTQGNEPVNCIYSATRRTAPTCSGLRRASVKRGAGSAFKPCAAIEVHDAILDRDERRGARPQLLIARQQWGERDRYSVSAL